MSLQEKLDAAKAKSKDRIPAPFQAVMARATEDLRHSGILDRMAKAGDTAPNFALPNIDGAIIDSQQLLERGPLVVSFYRGIW